MSIKGLFVHHIVHPLVMAGKGEPKDAGSLERYHHVVSSVKVYQLEQAQNCLSLGNSNFNARIGFQFMKF